jgi:hypothetical protein
LVGTSHEYAVVTIFGTPGLCFGPLATEARAKSSRRQENSAIILVPGEFRSTHLGRSLNFWAPLTKYNLKFRCQRADIHKSYLEV